MLFRRPGSLALASLSLLAAGCLAAPPFLASYSDPPTNGTRVSVGREIRFFRWGASCEIHVEPSALMLSRDGVSSRIEAFIPPDGLTVRWPESASDEIQIDRGTGTPVRWDDDDIEISDRWYDLGGDTLQWNAPLARVAGELGPHANFALGSVWMSTDATDLDLQVGSSSRVIEGALAGQTVQFTIEDLELPQVRFSLGDGRDALWVGENLWVNGEFQPAGR